jgi:hypothetical protein
MLRQRRLKLAILLTLTSPFLVIFCLGSEASAGPIPNASASQYPRSGTDPTSDAQTPAGSNLDFGSGAADVVNAYGDTQITNAPSSGDYYLWCSGDNGNIGHVIEKQNSNGCSTNSNSDEWAVRPQGVNGDTSTYEVITNGGTANGVTVTVVDACKSVSDNVGWEDHSTSLLQHGSTSPIPITVTAGNITYSSPNNCNGNNLVVPVTDFTDDSAHFGTGMDRALVSVHYNNPNQAGEKIFGIEASTGVYIGPADQASYGSGNYVNLQDPGADDGSNTASNYGTLSQCDANDANMCPQYSSLAQNVTPADTYNFYFSPDCSYSNQSTVSSQLAWQDAAGHSNTQNSGEQWTLYDNGNPVDSDSGFSNNAPTSFPVTFKVGDNYDWQWTGVDRAHGISVQLPFSEYTATSAFSIANCPPPPSNNALCSYLTVNDPVFSGTNYNGGIYHASSTSAYVNMEFYNDGTINWTGNYYIGVPALNIINPPVDPGSVYKIYGQHHSQLQLNQTPGQLSTTISFRVHDGSGDAIGTPCSVTIDWPTPNCNGNSHPCSATCNINVSGSLPGGYIQAGQPFLISLTFTNTSPGNYSLPAQLGGYPISINTGGWPGANTGSNYTFAATQSGNPDTPLGPGQTSNPIRWESTDAPPYGGFGPNTTAGFGSPYPSLTTIAAAVVYRTAISPNCTTTVDGYSPFTLNAEALKPSGTADEIPPGGLPYETGVAETIAGNSNVTTYPVYASTNSQVYKEGAFPYINYSQTTNYDTIHNSSNGQAQDTLNSTYTGINGVYGGDKYCSSISINGGAWDSGYLGGGGSGDIVDAGNSPSVNNYSSTCLNIVNEPYFKVYGSSIFAGGYYTGSSGFIPGGALKGWNTDTNPGDQGVGAGSQFLSMLVNGIISGVASGQNSATFVASPNLAYPGVGLSFANSFSNPNDASHLGDISAGVGNPNMGGDYAGNMSYPAEQSLVGPNQILRDTTGSGTDSTSIADLDTGTEKSYVYGTPTNQVNLTLTPGQVQTGHNISLYVNGNVQITPVPGGDTSITYAGNGSWNVTSGTSGGIESNIPSFSLVATGNIYIDPGITELDGLYEAGINNTEGELSTCAEDFTQVAPTDIFDTCDQQLTVVGSFVANQVNLLRTYGSLRDSTSTEDPNNGTSTLTCSNGLGRANVPGQKVCAAEVFNSDPELYLSNPALEPPSGGAIQWSSYTSLPPVL